MEVDVAGNVNATHHVNYADIRATTTYPKFTVNLHSPSEHHIRHPTRHTSPGREHLPSSTECRSNIIRNVVILQQQHLNRHATWYPGAEYQIPTVQPQRETIHKIIVQFAVAATSLNAASLLPRSFLCTAGSTPFVATVFTSHRRLYINRHLPQRTLLRSRPAQCALY